MAESRLSTSEQLESLWRLGGLTPSQLARRVWNEAQNDDVLGRASQLAYSLVLAVFPLLLVLISILGMLARRGTEMRQALFSALSSILPPSASELVSTTINEVTRASGGGKLTAGLILTLIAASGGTAAMMYALSAAYDVRDARPWYVVRAKALLLTVVISFFIIVALVVILAGGSIAESIGGQVGLSGPVLLAWKILQWIAAFFFVTLSFALVYYYGPDLKEQHWYWITPGSLIGVLVWLAVSFGFRAYLHFFDTYSKTYGSLGAAIILLVWLWVTGLAFLVGGEINAEIEHAAAHRGHPEAKAEGEKAA